MLELMTVRLLIRNLAWSDLGVALWVGLCVALGIVIGNQVRHLDRYGTTIDQSADALDEVVSALDIVAGLPFIGGEVREIADVIEATAARMRTSGSDTREAARNLSTLLAVAVSIVPTAPVLAFYVPYRAQQIRRNTELIRSLLRNRHSVFTRNYLANRALSELPYGALQQMGLDPWGQVRQGRVERLAAEELRRLGLDEELAALRAADEEAGG